MSIVFLVLEIEDLVEMVAWMPDTSRGKVGRSWS